uniref:Uncharacterized protein n=1 Tax=Micrurus lemniscatus lemniscatus TaxID=129467 RepID=A0A2D4HZC0_MICLE
MEYDWEKEDKKEESTKVSIEPEQNSRELPDPFQYSPPLQCNIGSTKSKVPATTIKSPHVPASHLEMKAEDSIQKRGLNIEKSVKDLQRCSVSLTRYRMMVKEEVDNSVKKMKAAFSELHNCLHFQVGDDRNPFISKHQGKDQCSAFSCSQQKQQ